MQPGDFRRQFGPRANCSNAIQFRPKRRRSQFVNYVFAHAGLIKAADLLIDGGACLMRFRVFEDGAQNLLVVLKQYIERTPTCFIRRNRIGISAIRRRRSDKNQRTDRLTYRSP